MHTSKFSMTNDLTLYTGDQTFLDNCPYLCSGQWLLGSVTTKAPGGKAGKFSIKGTFNYITWLGSSSFIATYG